MAASSTAAVLAAAVVLGSGVAWLAIVAAIVMAQSLWWFCFALGGVLRKWGVSRGLAAILVMPSAIGGALAVDVGLVDHNRGLAFAAILLLAGCVGLYCVVRRHGPPRDA